MTKSDNGDRLSGIFSYNIDSKVKRRLVNNVIYNGKKMTFLGIDTRDLNSSVWRVGVINLESDELEYYGQAPENIYPDKVIYSLGL